MAKPKYKIKRDDTVKVIAGKDKGAIGRVLKVFPSDKSSRARVLVEGVNRVRRHTRPQGERQGGIVTKEAPIHISNVALWNAEEGRRVKVGYRFEDGVKTRIDRKTGQPIDNA